MVGGSVGVLRGDVAPVLGSARSLELVASIDHKLHLAVRIRCDEYVSSATFLKCWGIGRCAVQMLA